MNIMEKIIAKKKVEVDSGKGNMYVATLENMPFFAGKTLSLKEFLLREDKTGIGNYF